MSPQDTAAESTPLLPRANDRSRQSLFRAVASFTDVFKHLHKWRALYLCGVLAFVVDFIEFMRVAPGIRMLELGVCRNYYSVFDPGVIGVDGDIKEELCKKEQIQTQLATVRGIIGVLEVVPGLTLAVPYGILADNSGRRLVCYLGMLGIVLAESWFYIVIEFYNVFPISLVYTSPLFLAIGGGGFVFSAAVLAIVADVVPSSARTQVFFLLSVSVLVSELLAPIAGSLLMDRCGANLTYLLGIPGYISGFLTIFFVPDTLNSTLSGESTPSEAHSDEPPKREGGIKQTLVYLCDHMRENLLPLMGSSTIVLGMLSLLVNNFGRPVFGILMQYMTIRFSWKLSQSAYLISFQAGIQIFLLCLVLPVILVWLTKKLGEDKANLILSKGSAVFLVLGTLGMGLSQNVAGIFTAIVVYTLGSGFGAGVRSFLTSLIPRSEIATLYTLISLFSSVGAMVGAPLLALTFSKVINIGGAALGFPFFFASVMFAVSGVSLWNIRSPGRVEAADDVASTESP